VKFSSANADAFAGCALLVLLLDPSVSFSQPFVQFCIWLTATFPMPGVQNHHDRRFSPDEARARGLTGTLVFPRGNLAPEGSVVKAASIDPSVVAADGVGRKEGPARVFVSEQDAMLALLQRQRRVRRHAFPFLGGAHYCGRRIPEFRGFRTQQLQQPHVRVQLQRYGAVHPPPE
jgi:hypothetical protein